MQLKSRACEARELQLLPQVLSNLITTTPKSEYLYYYYFSLIAITALRNSYYRPSEGRKSCYGPMVVQYNDLLVESYVLENLRFFSEFSSEMSNLVT